MGPNKIFNPHIRLTVIQCADPGGKQADLPTAYLNNCDSTTVQTGSLLVQSNGSFDLRSYTIYSLPSAALDEQPTWTPVCNATHACVLYVGEDYNDFSLPKVFSHPFYVTSGGSGG
jgi:hypothetical protein